MTITIKIIIVNTNNNYYVVKQYKNGHSGTIGIFSKVKQTNSGKYMELET